MIFLFYTLDKFKKFFRPIFPFPANYGEISVLVHCEDAEKHNLPDAIDQFTFGSFLIEEKNEISLNIITMYTEQKCGVPQLLEINRFSPSKIKWDTQQFFNSEFKDFYGCEISVKICEDKLPFSHYEHINGQLIRAEGAFYEMVVKLSKMLNFRIAYCLLCWKYELVVFITLENYHVEDHQLLSDTILSTSDVFIVPPGEPYTSWEKLLLPFDEATWMWLGITFAVAFLVIIFIKISRSTSMYEFVIGSNITTPALNVIAIFMGIGQILLPRRNISRFLFKIFVLFCLIMRTAYQGKYFKFITTDVRRRPITEIAELKTRNFTIFTEFTVIYNVTRIDALKG